MKSLEFRIRKLHVNTDADKRLQKRQPSRVYVNYDVLIELTNSADGGHPVYVEKVSELSGEEKSVRHEATLWKAPEKLDKAAAQMYDPFRDACDFKLGQTVRITYLGGTLPDAEDVVLEQVPTKEGTAPDPFPLEDLPGWEVFLAGRLSQVEHIYAGLTFKSVFLRGAERSFVAASVNRRSTGNARYIDRKTKVTVATTAQASGQADGVPSWKLKVTGVRGLDEQIKRLNQILSCFDADEASRKRLFYPGIVIHGGNGTGKTMLLNSIASTGWGTVFRIEYHEKLTEIQEVFQRAMLQQPSIVLIDQLERLIDKDRTNRAAVIRVLGQALDALATDAATRRGIPQVVIVATCLDYTAEVPKDLKSSGRFTKEIYLPLPDVASRKEILASLDLGVAPEHEQDLLRQLSERTHAYNGDDLRRLVGEAHLLGYTRCSETPAASRDGKGAEPPSPDDTNHQENGTTVGVGPAPFMCLPADYDVALRLVRPSAMHDVNLKPPPIKWEDIGGQEGVKKSLRHAAHLSRESPETLARVYDRPPKGFLLYGPPGCSKTMAAQAMATESGLNFFAVKGAELLNMYVGETERALRRLFQRAREVSPSMIFFDEIDSIAGQRSAFNSSASSSSGSTHGVNVLTTLLNEMDGFEALSGVIVLAATNRPHALDPALLRPGRFDELIYVGPPDEVARRAIFAKVAARRQMHPDVDIDRLARETDGYSGAEVKGICDIAGGAAYERYEAGDELVIKMQDLENAIRKQKKQITKEMLRGFEEWERQFRKH